MTRLFARALEAAAWTAIAGVAFEAIARQLTRTRPIPGLPESALVLSAIPAAALLLLVAARRLSLPGGAAAPPGRPRWTATAGVFAALFAAGLALQLHMGARLQSDAFYYFAYLRSIAFDGDVNFLNDYQLLGQGDKPQLFEPTVTGHAHSAWTIGPAIVWSPFFAAGHVAAGRLAAGGAAVSTDGTSYPYRQAIVIAGLVYALLACWFTWRMARRYTGSGVAGLSTGAAVGGSFMLWYTLVEPTMTHAPSMAVVAGFVWAWVATMGRRGLAGWAALGALAGLAGLIRWQNVIFAGLPAIEAVRLLWQAGRSRDPVAVRRVLTCGTAFLLAAVLAFSPQMLAWKAIYGTYFAVSPLGPTIDLLRPHLVDVLFSSRNGLLAMSPILYVAAIGLLIFAARRPAIGLPMIAVAGAMTWFNASIYDWWGSDGYGGRRFDGLIPLLVPGLAVAFETGRTLIARRPHLVAAGLLGGLVLWNVTLMTAAHRGIVRLGEPIAFREVGGEQARLLHAWIGHPFSYPVSLWYGARNGLSPAAYDLLAPFRFLGDRARPYGQIDVGGGDDLYIGEGWHAPERDGDRTFRWASRDALVVVPLDHAAPLDVEVRLRAYAPAGAPGQQVRLILDGREAGSAVVPDTWDTIVFRTEASSWRAGVTRLRLEFAWALRPIDAGGGGDTRELSAAVDNILVILRGAVR